MKSMILVLMTLASTSSMAAAKLDKLPCAQFAQGAAVADYLRDATGIQGHEYDSSIAGYTKLDQRQAAVAVAISGANDEGETWTAQYDVVVQVPTCALVEINTK